LNLGCDWPFKIVSSVVVQGRVEINEQGTMPKNFPYHTHHDKSGTKRDVEDVNEKHANPVVHLLEGSVTSVEIQRLLDEK
jgi:hypothetical protein